MHKRHIVVQKYKKGKEKKKKNNTENQIQKRRELMNKKIESQAMSS